jgi:hypothetical protein
VKTPNGERLGHRRRHSPLLSIFPWTIWLEANYARESVTSERVGGEWRLAPSPGDECGRGCGNGMRGRGCVAVRTHYKSRKGAVREPVQESLISAAAPSRRPEVSRASNNILKRKIYRRLSYEFIQVLSYPSVFDACLISHSNVYYR